MKKALIVIDMQNDFITGSLGTKEACGIVPAVRARCEQAAAEGEDILFTQDTHGADYLKTQEGRKLPVEHCIRGSHGWEICEELKPFAGTRIEKPGFGSIELAKACAPYEALELCGLCTDICVISNALLLKAFYPEKEILVDASLCVGVTPESHNTALSAMKSCQIELR